MGFIIDWMTNRVFHGWLDEIECWEIRQMTAISGVTMFVVTDLPRDYGLCLEAGDVIPERMVFSKEFSSRKEAESFIDYMCARAAVIRLLKFWKD